MYLGEDEQEGIRIQSMGFNDTSDLNHPEYSPPNVDQVIHMESNSSIQNNEGRVIAQSPPPPAYFSGYTLPPGNPCESFTLPPPPADKKRTGPRRKWTCLILFCFGIYYEYLLKLLWWLVFVTLHATWRHT